MAVKGRRPLTCRNWVELRGFEPLTPSMRRITALRRTSNLSAN
jgi:hypothetical protein